MSDEDLEWIVDNNNKKRFSYSEDMMLIRANQGHSINVDVQLEKVEPPHYLYHGTTSDNLNGIIEKGLLKMNRQHVHLTDDEDTAINVGLRYAKKRDKLLVLKIQAKLMSFDGYKFFLSKNGVYLTDHVPTKYLEFDD